MEANPILLKVGWTVLRLGDLKLFSTSTAWLNDDSINFYYEYLTQNKETKDVLLVSASTGALMVYEDIEELKDILAGLEFPSFKYWLIPVNDKKDPTSTGGMHWSLLCYDGENFYHLDSIGRSGNYSNAKIIIEKVSKLYLKDQPVKVIMEIDYARQENSYDCGMYVITASESILDNVLAGKGDALKELKEQLTPKYIKKKRQELYALFVSMLKEQNKEALKLLKPPK